LAAIGDRGKKWESKRGPSSGQSRPSVGMTTETRGEFKNKDEANSKTRQIQTRCGWWRGCGAGCLRDAGGVGGVSKAAAEPPHSKGSWRIGWSSFYKTSHSAEGHGTGHPSRRFLMVARRGDRSEISLRSARQRCIAVGYWTSVTLPFTNVTFRSL
jgi:hypothetical protein